MSFLLRSILTLNEHRSRYKSKSFISCVCCKPTCFSVFRFFQLLTIKEIICMHFFIQPVCWWYTSGHSPY